LGISTPKILGIRAPYSAINPVSVYAWGWNRLPSAPSSS
jgi:hypothetical protein